MKGIEFERGEWGTKAVICGEWQDSYLELLQKRQTTELELNDGKGWFGTSVEFLKYLPQLKSLVILRLPLESIEPVHHLTGLVNLGLITYAKTPVDFNCFPNLSSCSFEWVKGSDSLFDCKSLQGLGLNSYSNKSSEAFSNLVNLEKLTVLNSAIENVDGIARLTKLANLSLVNLRRLTSLDGIGNLKNLEVLEIQRCKRIVSVSEIFELGRLKQLLLLDLGGIESIRGIEGLKELKEFFFYDSTNILDGDLSPILKLQNLSKISFQNRKHYTHRREDFGRLYA